MRFANGTIFHGKRQGSGLLSGQGTFTFNDGTSYTGDIINGRRHGYGHLKTNRTADTAAYIGTWSTGVREGQVKKLSTENALTRLPMF